MKKKEFLNEIRKIVKKEIINESKNAEGEWIVYGESKGKKTIIQVCKSYRSALIFYNKLQKVNDIFDTYPMLGMTAKSAWRK